MFLIPIELQNLKHQEGLQFHGPASCTDCFSPHRTWQTMATSVLILCPHVPGPPICWGWWCSLHRARRLWQTFRKVSVLEEFNSVKKLRESIALDTKQRKQFCGQILVHRWEKFEVSLCAWVGEGSNHATSTLFIRNMSALWENLLIYVLTR